MFIVAGIPTPELELLTDALPSDDPCNKENAITVLETNFFSQLSWD